VIAGQNKRFFSDDVAEKIRDFQRLVGHGIDMLSDSEIAELQSIVGSHGRTVNEFRNLLAHERRLSKDKRGPEPYLNYRETTKRAVDAEKQSELTLKPSVVSNDQEYVETKILHVEDLHIDESYQRSDVLNKSVVNRIAANFSLVRCNTIVVGQRIDGSLWVVDGQHRLLGARKAGVEMIPCAIFKSNGPEHEATVFYDLNKTRTGMNAYSVYKAMLIQREPKTVAIQILLQKYGFRIGNGSLHSFKAASAIREVYEQGVLDKVLCLIRDISEEDTADRWTKMLSQSHFIQSLGIIYSSKTFTVDESRMRIVFTRMSELEYQRLASSYAGATGGRAKRIAPALIENYYNKNLRIGRIDV
jgi:hypothetical protein